jgi:oxalate decarboxylase
VNEQHKDESPANESTRGDLLGAAAPAAIAAAALAGWSARAQTRENTRTAEHDNSASDPGPENKVLRDLNPNSNLPPPTDHGDIGPIWYSFDLAYKRVQGGGWTHQVTQRELPSSKEIAGVNMRLTAGSFRELHWHTADEWSMMLYGNARVSVLNPDGTVSIDDVSHGDLWYFPAGFPHSIQGLGPDGCEFLLVFDDGRFSENDTFLLSDWVSHVPTEVLSKNFGLDKATLAKLPDHSLYIFPAALPNSLAQDRAAVGGQKQQSPIQYTFKTQAMAPTSRTPGGETRVVDSRNFPASKNIAAGIVTVKPGGVRELHWHPNASEWQYYVTGKARMTAFTSDGARTMDFNTNDVGFVPPLAGHYIENTGNTDLVFLEMFKANQFMDFSLNNWLRHLPPEMVTSHLNLDENAIKKIPAEKMGVIPA